MGKILIIAEKPSAGRDIARILKVTQDKKGYMESDEYIISWAVGHLVELKDPEDIDEVYKTWKVEDIPLPADNGLKVKESGKAQFYILKKLIDREDITYLINAGDAGREGLLIQSWIYRMAGNQYPVKILWASSLTDEAIKNAMSRLHNEDETIFQNLLLEAETRAIADQVYGYNYTRLLTCLYAGGRTVLSYGRCQTPLLNLIVKRDIEHENFVSQSFWNLSIRFKEGFTGTEIGEDDKTKKYLQKDQGLTAVNICNQAGKAVILSCIKEQKSKKAPVLYNLAELQGVMGKKYGFTPDKTLQIAQALYEKHKILSYPRTDSRYLSTDIFNEITEHLKCCCFGKFKEYIDKIQYIETTMDKTYFNDNKVSDHHALIPTINKKTPDIYAQLTEDERNCFDEIIVSLIAIFYPEYQYEAAEVITRVEEKLFRSSGSILVSSGYQEVYQLLKIADNNTKNQEDDLQQQFPELREGQELEIEISELKEGKTQPPALYNPGNIIKLMGKYKIGTSATSAGIIQNLIDRGFVKLEKNKYTSTELGRKLLQFIPNILKSPNMTIEFEEKLQKVNTGEISKETFIEEIQQEIKINKQEFMKNIPAEKLGGCPPIGKCPLCGRNIKNGKKNWYCEGYKLEPRCSFTIWKEIAGKKISETEVKKLIRDKRTGLIKGFIAKNNNRFDAYLVLKSDEAGTTKIVFAFPDKKGGKK